MSRSNCWELKFSCLPFVHGKVLSSIDPTAFSVLAWLLVVQNNVIPSWTQLGFRDWYWHVRRLEHWRSWQVVMADFFHVSPIFEGERVLDL